MAFYLTISAILWCLALLEADRPKPRRKVVLLIVVALAAISGLRFETGYDWLIYERVMNNVPTLSELVANRGLNMADFVGISGAPMEPIYLLVNVIIKTLGGSLQTVILLTAIFNFVVFYRFAQQFEFPLLAFAAFFGWVFLSLHMAAIRESIAISLVLLAFLQLNDGKLWKYMSLVALAAGFQYSAIIYIPLYFVITKRPPKIVVYAVFAVLLSLYAAKISVVSSILTGIQYLTPASLAEKIDFYNSQLLPERSIGAASYAVFNGVVFGIGLTALRDSVPDTRFNNTILNLSLLFCVTHLLTAEVPVLWQRLQYIALFGQFALIPVAVRPFGQLARVSICVGLAGLTIAFQTWQLSQSLAAPYLPYQSYPRYLITGNEGDGRDRTISYFDELNAAIPAH